MRLLLLFYLSALFLLFTSCNRKHVKEDLLLREVALRMEPKPGNPRNSEGDFINLNDGRILFVYSHFTGGTGDNSSAFLAGRFSSDKGKTWTQKDVMVLPNEGKMNTMSVSMLRMKNGKIAMLYLRKDSENKCMPYIRFSGDEAETWSNPLKCAKNDGYYVVNNDRLIQLSDGRLIFPASLHEHSSAHGVISAFYSDDNGKTWKQSASVPNPGNVVLQEPGIVVLKDGTVFLFSRTNKGVQYFSRSTDKGETWSPIEPGNIKSPLSPASIKRIPSTGDLLLVWNNNYQKERNGGRRTPLNVAVSKDEGRTWVKVKTVESDPMGWYCYTAIDFDDDYVLLGHCAGDTRTNNGLSTTNITRLNLDWIYGDATPDPYVLSEDDGVLKLACDDKNAVIRYTLDGSLPGKDKGKLYEGPVRLSYPVVLFMQSFSEGKTVGAIVEAQVGENAFLESVEPSGKIIPGLKYYYYEGGITNTGGIENLMLKRSGITSSVDTDKKMRDEEFAIVFKGLVKIPSDDKYIFYLISNDGSTLSIDGHKIIDNDGAHGTAGKTVTVSLRKGYHEIELKYFQLGGGYRLGMMIESENIPKQKIPGEILFHRIDSGMNRAGQVLEMSSLMSLKDM